MAIEKDHKMIYSKRYQTVKIGTNGGVASRCVDYDTMFEASLLSIEALVGVFARERKPRAKRLARWGGCWLRTTAVLIEWSISGTSGAPVFGKCPN